MTTKQNLIEAATKKKYQIDTSYETLIGINKGKGVWHWWNSHGLGEEVFFDHSYSQNTGRTCRSALRGIRLEASLGL